MSSFSRVIETLDIVKDIRPSFRSGLVLASVHTLSFEQAEETLSGRVVGTTAGGAHAADEAVALQETLVFVTSELTAPVRMQDDRRVLLSLPQRP